MTNQIKKVMKAQGWEVKTVAGFIVATSKGENGELFMSSIHVETLMSTVLILDSKGAPLGIPSVFKFSFPVED